jgi:CHAD domain-containing protein
MPAAAPAAAAVAALLAAQRSAAAALESGIVADADPEALHDYRVALRRARSLLKHCIGLFEPATCEVLRRQLAWIARATGARRDLDVFIAALDAEAAKFDARQRVQPLHTLLLRRRNQAHGALLRTLQSDRYAALGDAWKTFSLAAMTQSAGPQPILAEVARSTVDELQRTVARTARRLGAGSRFERLHALRKDCKELRYLLEAFRPLSPVRCGKLIAALRKMQDVLGAICDLHVQRQMLAHYRLILRDPQLRAVLLELDRRLAQRERRRRQAFPDRRDRFLRRRRRRQFERLAAELLELAVRARSAEDASSTKTEAGA